MFIFYVLADSPSNYTLTEAGPNSPVKAGSIPGGSDANGIGNRRTSAASARDPSGAESEINDFLRGRIANLRLIEQLHRQAAEQAEGATGAKTTHRPVQKAISNEFSFGIWTRPSLFSTRCSPAHTPLVTERWGILKYLYVNIIYFIFVTHRTQTASFSWASKWKSWCSTWLTLIFSSMMLKTVTKSTLTTLLLMIMARTLG